MLEPYRDRVTWDARDPLGRGRRGAAVPAARLNCKPSRFGSIRELFRFYDHCAEHGIQLYGGGQFELGPGRGQIQYLASLLHPDTPNDVAPGGYNSPGAAAGAAAEPARPGAGPDRLPLGS